MKSHIVSLLVASAAALVCGCGRGSEYQPKPVAKVETVAIHEGVDQNLMPFKVGNEWTFVANVSQNVGGRQRIEPPASQVFKITKVENTPQGARATFEVTLNGSLSSRLIWLANDKGIYQVADGLSLKPVDPPKPIIVFPAEKGKTFSWSGIATMTDGKPGRTKSESMILAPQEVETEVGRLSAICVESKVTFGEGKDQSRAVSSIWLVPGVGMALYTQDTGMDHVVLKLKKRDSKR